MEMKKRIMEFVQSSDRRLTIEEVAQALASSMGVPEKKVKRSMNELVFEHQLEFTYYGKSYVEPPLSNMEDK